MVFNEVDWCILGIIVISTVISLWRGFIKEILSLIIWVVAVVVAWLYGGSFSNYFAHTISLTWLRIMVGCGSLFVLTLIVGGVINFVLARLISATGLSGTDRFLGMFFGAGRGAVAIVICVGLLIGTPFQQTDWWKKSQLIPHFLLAANWSKNIILGGWQSIETSTDNDVPLQPNIDLPISPSE